MTNLNIFLFLPVFEAKWQRNTHAHEKWSE